MIVGLHMHTRLGDEATGENIVGKHHPLYFILLAVVNVHSGAMVGGRQEMICCNKPSLWNSRLGQVNFRDATWLLVRGYLNTCLGSSLLLFASTSLWRRHKKFRVLVCNEPRMITPQDQSTSGQ